MHASILPIHRYLTFHILCISAQMLLLTDKECGLNEEYDTCGTACPRTCQKKHTGQLPCAKQCASGCFCRDGYILDNPDGNCIKKSYCPTSKEELNTTLTNILLICSQAVVPTTEESRGRRETPGPARMAATPALVLLVDSSRGQGGFAVGGRLEKKIRPKVRHCLTCLFPTQKSEEKISRA